MRLSGGCDGSRYVGGSSACEMWILGDVVDDGMLKIAGGIVEHEASPDRRIVL